MDKQKTGLMVAVAAGAYYLLTQKGTPTYYDMQGRPITAITCGSSATFNVSGYHRVWLSILKDGVLSFDEPFDLPMAPYVFSCTNDIGVYHVAAYEIDANNVKGKLIGQTVFTVHSQA